MMSLSRATRKMLKKTETRSRKTFIADCGWYVSSTGGASGLAATLGDVLAVFAECIFDLALSGVVGR